jgi:hypothetical protein
MSDALHEDLSTFVLTEERYILYLDNSEKGKRFAFPRQNWRNMAQI